MATRKKEPVARSQNGWTANQVNLMKWFRVPGTNVSLKLRAVYAGPLLVAFAEAFHKHVEPISDPGCWSYASRPIRGSTTTLSNHASGTAIDLNAPRHPLGKSGTFTPPQVRQIQRLLAATGGAIRWGGNYSGRKDEMHFELNTTNIEQVIRATLELRKLV